jgi:hypothetical protein
VENRKGSDIIKGWPEESQEAAQLVIDTYGEPQEANESLLTWHEVGPWKRVLASREYFEHNFPALNLMHDIVTGAKDVQEARAYYAEEFLNARRKQPTPCMEQLRFRPGTDTTDPDQRVLSDQDLEQAVKEGERSQS